MDAKQRRQIEKKWRQSFLDLDVYGPPHVFKPRQLAGLYAVASICYHGNEHSPIRDDTFDVLCDWILENFHQCVSDGADLLDKDLLDCHSGYDVGNFVKPYHDIAAVLVGHECRCASCNGE